MARLQFITHFTEKYSYLDSARLALEGGCRWIQLRMKGTTDDEVRPVALEVQRLCRERGATFVVDDRVELARELHADGVHLGKNDMPIAEARRRLGPGFLIGGTANTAAEAEAHFRAGADYIGCGPFRYTTTKQNLAPLLGLEGYRAVLAGMKAAGVTLPLVAIGGIGRADIPALLETGVSGIALSGSILRAPDPVAEMRVVCAALGE